MSDTLKTFSRGLDRLIDDMPPEGETEAFNQWLDKLRNHVTKGVLKKSSSDDLVSPLIFKGKPK